MTPVELEKVKRKLRNIYKKGRGPVSISTTHQFEVFLWCAKADNPTYLINDIRKTDSAIYLAYESKLKEPTNNELIVDIQVQEKKVSFDSKDKLDSWRCIFRGISVRAKDYGDLPCESYKSKELFIFGAIRQFEIVGNSKFDSYHFEPLLLNLTGKG